ncbi:MAG: hypothetical protein ABI207_02870 [Crocinitomicaceae bacterium]
MNLLEFDNSLKSSFYIESYLEYTPEYEFIKSSGFDSSFIFFKILARPYFDKSKSDTINGNISNPVYFGNLNYDFIFGYCSLNNKLYRLKGMKQNDFDELFSYISKSPIYIKSNFKSISKFSAFFQVEGLDLKCLYISLHKQNTKNCDCLKKAKPIYNGISW